MNTAFASLNPWRAVSWSVLTSVALALSGCGDGRSSPPVKVDVARETLRATLEKWQAGATPDSLQQETPKIVVQDFDWSGGARLIAFEVLNGDEPVDANLIAKVKLTLQTGEAAPAEKTVTYVVGTSPVLTVFRDMFR